MSSEILSEPVSSILPKTGTGCPRMPDANRPANALEQVPATWSPLRRRQLGEEQRRPSEPRKHDETMEKTPKRDLSPFSPPSDERPAPDTLTRYHQLLSPLSRLPSARDSCHVGSR